MTEPVETPTNTTPLDKLTPEIERMWTHLDAAEGASALAEGALSGAEKKLLEAQGEARRTKAEAEDLRLKIGALLLEARKQCKHGDWEEWFKANIPQRSLRDAQKLIKVASTDDPKSAREKEKEKNREAQQRRRAKASDTTTVSRFSTAAPNPPIDVWNAQTEKVVTKPADDDLAAAAQTIIAYAKETDAPAAEPEPDFDALRTRLAAFLTDAPWNARSDLAAAMSWSPDRLDHFMKGHRLFGEKQLSALAAYLDQQHGKLTVADEETAEQQVELIVTAGDDRRDPVNRIMDIINEAALRLSDHDLEHLHDRLRDYLDGLTPTAASVTCCLPAGCRGYPGCKEGGRCLAAATKAAPRELPVEKQVKPGEEDRKIADPAEDPAAESAAVSDPASVPDRGAAEAKRAARAAYQREYQRNYQRKRRAAKKASEAPTNPTPTSEADEIKGPPENESPPNLEAVR